MSDGAIGPAIASPDRWSDPRLVAVPAVVAVVLVLIATRQAPLLSPDSITYLSAAAHVHDGRGLIDFTMKPLTVFGPIYPLLLAPGGRSLGWARVVGASSIAACAVSMWWLLRTRTRPVIALAGGLAFGCSLGIVRIASVVWSEAPYAFISLATIAVVSRRPLRTRSLVIGGTLAALGFLTRYAGAGLLLTAAVMVLAPVIGGGGGRRVLRDLSIFAAPPLALIGVWVVRNIAEAGQPLGPRFEGGVHEPISTTVHLALIGTGKIVIGDSWSQGSCAWLGGAVIASIAIVAALLIRADRSPADAAMALYAATSVLIPIVARRITANDIELRVMSPMMLPVVYFAIVGFDRLPVRRVAFVGFLGAAVLGWWCYQGTAFAVRFTDLAPGGSGYKSQYAPELYDEIRKLPADAIVLTNNPQRVWWFTQREPTLMGFTRPRPGNSHYPIDAQQTVRDACSGRAYLAWFSGLLNAGAGPDERRPDLTALVTLDRDVTVPGGTLYHLVPRDTAEC